MILQDYPAWATTTGAGRWRRDSMAWTLSVSLHIPLLLLKGVPYMIPDKVQPPPPPVQVTLTQDENVSAPPRQTAGPSGKSRGGGSVLSRIKSAFSKKDPWEDFEVSDSWNKAPAASSAFTPKGGPSSNKSKTGGGGGLRMAGEDLSKVAEAWTPKGNTGKPTLIAKRTRSLDDDDEFGQGGGIKGSPWKAPRAGGGGGGGGELRGGSHGDPADIAANQWGASGAQQRRGGTDEGSPGGSKFGGSRGGGGDGLYDLSGPLSRRKVIYSIVPEYPDWAREKGLEAVVTVYFTVMPDGKLKEPLIIKKGSGDPRIDALVLKNLRHWKFAALKGSQEVQWGLITFRFQLQ